MVEPLWTGQDVATATGGDLTLGFDAYGVAIDTRELRPGDLFIALAGENADGHAYLTQAFEAGAVGALVSSTDSVPDGMGAVCVPDTFAALEDLGRAARARLSAKIIGVTGSVGKTGTKNALRDALARSGATYASERSFNNHIGVPLTLARTPQASDFAVLEMGMNHAGELSALTAMAQPDVAVITTVEAVHTANFDSVAGIADAKAEILEGVPQGGTAILNRDNPYFARMNDKAVALGIGHIMTFGEHEEATVRLVKSRLHTDCSVIVADIEGFMLTCKIGVPGAHWVHNSLVVLAAVSAAGGDLGLAGLALADMHAPKGRGQRHTIPYMDGEVLLIDESYNASPVAVRAALTELGRAIGHSRRGRKIAVLGDMLELGETEVADHAALADAVAEAGVDLLVTVGPLMAALAHAVSDQVQAHRVTDADKAAALVRDLIRPGDVMMVKGSNAVGLSRVVDALLALQDRPNSDVATG